MEIILHNKVVKAIRRLNEPTKSRIVKALELLSKDPPQGDIKSMTGRDGYRLRVGAYRLLFDREEERIIVYDIGLRGQIYKGGE